MASSLKGIVWLVTGTPATHTQLRCARVSALYLFVCLCLYVCVEEFVYVCEEVVGGGVSGGYFYYGAETIMVSSLKGIVWLVTGTPATHTQLRCV